MPILKEIIRRRTVFVSCDKINNLCAKLETTGYVFAARAIREQLSRIALNEAGVSAKRDCSAAKPPLIRYQCGTCGELNIICKCDVTSTSEPEEAFREMVSNLKRTNKLLRKEIE